MRWIKPLAAALVGLGLSVTGVAMAETIHFTVNGKTYPVEMADTPDAASFVHRLPLTLTFENFGSKERIAYPKPAIDVQNVVRPFEIPAGTMTIYRPWGNIAIFLVDFDWNAELTELGRLTAEGLEAIRTSGSNPVTFMR